MLVAFLLVCGFLFVRVAWPVIHDLLRQGSQIQALLGVATVIALVFQSLISRQQAKIANHQRKLMKKQLRAATAAARAAETAANAALAALDRPWIVISDTRCSATNWRIGEGDLIAEIEIGNYGKTPAFVHSVRMFMFLSYEPWSSAPYSGVGLPGTIIRFPDPREFRSFVQRHGKWPLIDVSGISPWTEMLDSGAAAGRHFGHTRFDSPLTLPGNTLAERYFIRESPLISACDSELPDEHHAEIFLVGEIVYSGLTLVPEFVSFCYKANRFGGLEAQGGAPYNERGKVSARLEIT